MTLASGSSTPASNAGTISSSPQRTLRGRGATRCGSTSVGSIRPSTLPMMARHGSSTTMLLPESRFMKGTGQSGCNSSIRKPCRWHRSGRCWSMAASISQANRSGQRGRISILSMVGTTSLRLKAVRPISIRRPFTVRASCRVLTSRAPSTRSLPSATSPPTGLNGSKRPAMPISCSWTMGAGGGCSWLRDLSLGNPP